MSTGLYLSPDAPEHWIHAQLGEVLDVIRGASPRPKGDPRYFGGAIPWVMISDISREKGKYLTKTRDTVTEEGAKKSRLMNKGTLILSNSGTVCVPKILSVSGCIHDGFVALEIGAGQEQEVSSIMIDKGLTTMRSIPDLAGIPRCLLAKLTDETQEV